MTNASSAGFLGGRMTLRGGMEIDADLPASQPRVLTAGE
jgi:hypothetical protein